MEIKIVRADGVLFTVDTLNGKKIDSDHSMPIVFLSWEEVDRLALERAGYKVLKETVRNFGCKPKNKR